MIKTIKEIRTQITPPGFYDIYIVREGETVLYVGQSPNIPARIRRHLHDSRSRICRYIAITGKNPDNWTVEFIDARQQARFIEAKDCPVYLRNIIGEVGWREKVAWPGVVENALTRIHKPKLLVEGW